MKRWWILIALLLSLGINIGLLAGRAFQPRPTADGGERGDVPERPRGDRLPPVVHRMADELGLGGKKRRAFIEIQRDFFEQTLSARGRMARIQGRVRGEVTSGDPNRETLDALLVELSEAHIDLERAFVYNLLDSRELLDAGQERRFMRFLHRMHQVRSEVEKRFRERWRGQGEAWDRHDRRRRPFGPGHRPGDFQRGRPAEPPREDDESRPREDP